MNVGIGTGAAQFLFWEYLFPIYECVFAVHIQHGFICRPSDSTAGFWELNPGLMTIYVRRSDHALS
jgi:hypothetical protein